MEGWGWVNGEPAKWLDTKGQVVDRYPTIQDWMSAVGRSKSGACSRISFNHWSSFCQQWLAITLCAIIGATHQEA